MSRLAAFAALLLCCFPVYADAVAAARLGESLEGVRRIEGRFRQTLTDEQGNVVQESQGSVELAHPGRFRWETADPFPQLVVSDGSTVWQYDPDLAQVVVRPFDRRADQIPSLLLSGEVAAVERLYEITSANGPSGVERFELVPRDESSPFARLAVQFRGGVLERLEITDALGQRTRVMFEGIRELATVDERRFRFETPPGVDEVVDE